MVHRVTKSQTWLKQLSMYTEVLETIPGRLSIQQSLTHDYDLLQQNNTVQNQQRKMSTKVWRSQGQSPKGPFPEKSDKARLKSPVSICDNMCKMLQTSEAHLRIIALGFYWAWSHKWHVSESIIPNPEKSQEQMFSINHISFTNTFDTVNNSYQ